MRNLTRAAIAFLSATCFIGSTVAGAQEPIQCGPAHEKHTIIEHKNEHPMPTPASDKAIVYVIRKPGARWRWMAQSKLALNGRWVAVLNRGQYTFFEAEPGLLQLCFAGAVGTRTQNSYLLLTAQAGRSYYVRVDTGAMAVEAAVSEIDEADGRSLLKRSRYATWEVKK
jgi:hypothetical protein